MPSGDAFPAAYLDFEKGQAAAQLTTPTGFITDGSPKHRYIWSRFFQGEGVNIKKIQYGKNIEYSTILSQRSSGESYSPGAISSPTNTQHLVKGSAYWRFHRWNKMYNKKELAFNGEGPLTQQFVDLWTEKQALLDQDINDFMEDRFWAVPYKGLMEGSGDDAIEPYSIWAHVNEDASGLFGEQWTGQTWTTKQGLDPTTSAYGNNMKPQKQSYAGWTWGTTTHVVGAMHNLIKKMTWEMPLTMNAYWESDKLNKMVIVTDTVGHTKFVTGMQGAAGGDIFLNGGGGRSAGVQDPSSPDPQFFGIPITWNDTFEAAAVYDNGTNGLALQTAAAGTSGNDVFQGPRYMFLNGNYIVPTVKADNMFVQDTELRDTNRPDTYVIYVELDWNLVCTSYKRQGILTPSGNI